MMICLIIFNSAWFSVNIEERLIVARSEAQCAAYAANLGHGNYLVRYPYHNSVTSEQLCGPDLKDCEDIR